MLNNIYNRIKKFILPKTERELRVKEWKKNGNERLRYNYDLDQNSVVFDLGGYKGNWSSDIFSMYACKIYIFEPVKKYYDEIKKRFAKNSSISVFNIGLSKKDDQILIGLDNDGSGIFNKKSTENEYVKMVKASDFLEQNNINKIDLMKINIEGGEYDLLENLIDSGCINMIKNIQIQFHDFVPNSIRRMTQIRADLAKTHQSTYKVDFVWENWKLIKNN